MKNRTQREEANNWACLALSIQTCVQTKRMGPWGGDLIRAIQR